MLINLQDLATEINFKHQQCQADPINAMAYAYSLGQLLLEIQTLLLPLEWQIWFKTNCYFSESCAETYMQIARSWPSFRTILDSNRKVDISSIKDIPQMPLIPSDAQDNFEEDVEMGKHGDEEMEVNKIIEADNLLLREEEITTEDISNASLSHSEVSKNAAIINFYIPGKVVPKARPRVTTNGTYVPPRYRAWRNLAEVEIYRQISELNLTTKLPIQKAAISISFCGKHRTNSDLDNLAGACLDALTLNGAGVLQDDRLSCIPKLTIEYIPNTKETGVWIKIEILSVGEGIRC